MSFLNPVNEPVLRFKSTDAGAPQINYNARTAGDIKAVLKACLVTGYGAVPSAGWAAENEVGNVIEFVSPSAAMSDYRLGIDDSTAAGTNWYYQYQSTKSAVNAVSKSVTSIVTSNTTHSWDVLVTERGIMLIETVFNKAIQATGSSITYWGQLKSAVSSASRKNIAWWCLGYNSPSPNDGRPSDFFSSTFLQTKRTYELGDLVLSGDAHPAIDIFKYYNQNTGIASIADIKVSSEWYLIAELNIVAQQPAILLQTKPSSEIYSKSTGTHNGRPALYVWPIRGTTTLNFLINGSNVVAIIYLDYWEY